MTSQKSMYKETASLDIEQNEQDQLYRRQFQRLGADCQRILNLFFDKVSMSDIAQKMGFSSVSYAKKRKFQCKQKLVKLIKEDPLFQELNA